MNNKLFLQNLIAYNINFVLWGSEAGIIHGYNIQSNKDIDLLIQDTSTNLDNLYLFLSKFFTSSSQLSDIEAIKITTKDKKYFDIRKKYTTPVWNLDYDTAISEAVLVKCLDCDILAISDHHYVKTLELALSYPKKTFTKNKRNKYKNVIFNYYKKQ